MSLIADPVLTPPTKITDIALAPAITYLRVSTKEQATKGGHDEGFLMPAQRAANMPKPTRSVRLW